MMATLTIFIEPFIALLNNGLDSYISKVATLSKTAEICFKPWKIEIMKLLKAKNWKINSLQV